MDPQPTSKPPREEDPADAVEALVQDFLRRFAAGENPDPQKIAARHPALAPGLGEALTKAQRIARARRQAPAPEHGVIEESVQTSNSHLDETTPPDRPRKTRRDDTPELPEQFGRYRILKLLGQGNMGAVYLAEDTELKRKVALKAPKIHADDGPEVIERFYREARLAATLRHPHICPVYDIGQIDGVLFISMAYIEGKPLSAFISSDKPPSERSCAAVIRKLAYALSEAHALGIIHRDLKPANVMIDKKGEPVVMDFGLARHDKGPETTRLTQAGAIVGSPAYMAPEQVVNSSDLTPAADIHSLGVILYELLTGTLPFQGSLTTLLGQILRQEAPPPSSRRGNLDPEMEAICLRMLAKRPEDRYPSMTAVAEALTLYLKKSAPSKLSLVSTPPPDPASESDAIGASKPMAPPPLPPPLSVTIPPPAPSTDADPLVATAPATTALPQSDSPYGPRRFSAPAGLSGAQKMGAGAALLAAVVLILAAVIVLRTDNGVLVVKVMEPDVQVEIDGHERMVIDSKLMGRIELSAGPHHLVVKRGEEELYATSFSLRRGGELLVEAHWTPIAAAGAVRAVAPAQQAASPESAPPKNAASDTGPQPRSPAGAETVPGPGWISLFNGRDLEGWNVLGGDAWQVRDGAIDNAKGPPGSYLTSEASFADFELELEYRMAPGANSGVYFRAPANLSRNSTEYLEVQLLDTQRPSPLTNSQTRINGALYDVVEVSQEAPVIPNAWNRLSLRAEGDHVTVRVNGVETADVDLEELRRERPSMPGLSSRDGHIHLQYHSGKVEFRNFRLKDLTPAPRTHQGHAYQFFAERLSWHDARSRCEDLGGHLAIIESAEENAFVASLVAVAGWEDAWIGISDEEEEGTWLTVRGEPLGYTNWYGNQPNNKPPGEHYALISNRTVSPPIGWRWCDQPAEPAQHQPGFVCEWDDATDSKGFSFGAAVSPAE